jgi:hypothetical protein
MTSYENDLPRRHPILPGDSHTKQVRHAESTLRRDEHPHSKGECHLVLRRTSQSDLVGGPYPSSTPVRARSGQMRASFVGEKFLPTGKPFL